jgi:hypothetical protein
LVLSSGVTRGAGYAGAVRGDLDLTAQNDSVDQSDRQTGTTLEEVLPSLEDLGVNPEMVEAAEEIVDRSDVIGVERHTLELLLRRVFAMHRRDLGDIPVQLAQVH